MLERFELKLLTEGSGTQIFSTVFAQWAAREALRRAQPLTLLVRFAPRQRQRPMNELLDSRTLRNRQLDFIGSLIDADMGAYYNWLNQQRLAGAEQSSFLVWFEGHSQALAIGPGTPRGTESRSPADLRQLLEWTREQRYFCLASEAMKKQTEREYYMDRRDVYETNRHHSGGSGSYPLRLVQHCCESGHIGPCGTLDPADESELALQSASSSRADTPKISTTPDSIGR